MPVPGATLAMSDRRRVGRAGRGGQRLAAAEGAAIGMFINWETVETCGSGICTATK